MTETKLYATRAEIRRLDGLLAGVIGNQEKINLSMIGNCIDVFGDEEGRGVEIDDERRAQKILVYNLRNALALIAVLAERCGKEKP